MAITQECCVQSWTSPGSNTPQDTNCTATCPLSRKLFKLGEPDMQDIAGDELIRDVLLWIPTHCRAKAGRPARTYIQQLCEDTGCCPEDLPRAMNDREEWRERVRDIRAASTIWWWWWYLLHLKYGNQYADRCILAINMHIMRSICRPLHISFLLFLIYR